VSRLDGLHPVTTEGQILLHIAGQLDELIAAVRPDQPPVEPADPEPTQAPADDKPVAKKAAAKKTTSRRKVTGR
jgi:hypothetical protein